MQLAAGLVVFHIFNFHLVQVRHFIHWVMDSINTSSNQSSHVVTAGTWSIAFHILNLVHQVSPSGASTVLYIVKVNGHPPYSSLRPSLPQSEKNPPCERQANETQHELVVPLASTLTMSLPSDWLVLSEKWVNQQTTSSVAASFQNSYNKKTWSTWPLTNPSSFCIIICKSNGKKASYFYQLSKFVPWRQPNTTGGNETLTTNLYNMWNVHLVCCPISSVQL